MKVLALVSVSLIAFGLASCGGAGVTTESFPTASARTAVAGPIKDPSKPPKAHLPPGPPPADLVVRDIKKGHGVPVPAKGGVKITTNFVSVSYRTGKLYEVRWSPKGSFNIGFGPGLEIKGWEKGLVGMKVGGRRELIVPSRLAYEQGALLYVIDLLGVE